MKKTQLIKILLDIEGDPDLSFIVDNDEILSDYNTTVFQSIDSVRLEPELIYDDVIYFDEDELRDHIESCSFFEHDDVLDAHIEEIKKAAKEKIFIRITH